LDINKFKNSLSENFEYLTKQLITCIGNKRSLLPNIHTTVLHIKKRLKKNHLRILDAFSGSGIVSRYFKQHAKYLATIDIEDYATVIARCYLKNKSEINLSAIKKIVINFNNIVENVEFPMGFIEEMYAPKSINHITKDDRVFYTPNNARRIDNYRRLIMDLPISIQNLFIGPLLSEASIHTNTSGVFKGFYKDKKTKVGRFGGTNGDALKRILGQIQLAVPILSQYECEVDVFQGDANKIAPTLKDLDLVYLDPPYNQHPYGSNYFMLNLIANYKKPEKVSKVSGIPVDWRRSKYNSRSYFYDQFYNLLKSLQSRFLIISFNNEGFISRNDIIQMLKHIGSVEITDIKYNTFRGCRNINNREKYVNEQLFLVEKF